MKYEILVNVKNFLDELILIYTRTYDYTMYCYILLVIVEIICYLCCIHD
jgi:hypothetical protein